MRIVDFYEKTALKEIYYFVKGFQEVIPTKELSQVIEEITGDESSVLFYSDIHSIYNVSHNIQLMDILDVKTSPLIDPRTPPEYKNTYQIYQAYILNQFNFLRL